MNWNQPDRLCFECGTAGVFVIAFNWSKTFPTDAVFCSYECAKLNGWPWIPESEKKNEKPKSD